MLRMASISNFRLIRLSVSGQGHLGIQKFHTHKIASPPNDLAAVDIVEIIECKFEIQGQDKEVLQLNSCAALRYIPDVASKHAALFIEKQQRAF